MKKVMAFFAIGIAMISPLANRVKAVHIEQLPIMV